MTTAELIQQLQDWDREGWSLSYMERGEVVDLYQQGVLRVSVSHENFQTIQRPLRGVIKQVGESKC